MFSAVLLAVAVAALGQFALYYWRAVLSSVAAQPISSRVLEAVNVGEAELCGADFEKLSQLLDLTPELKRDGGGLGLVCCYYRAIGKMSELLGGMIPTFMMWSEQERALCARYAAVQIDHRLEANLAQAASIRSC
jgi:hypothetical protein